MSASRNRSQALDAAGSFEAGIHSKGDRLSVAPIPRLALKVEEAAAALGVSENTWHDSIEPHVRIVRLGRRKLVPVAEIERWLAENAEATL